MRRGSRGSLVGRTAQMEAGIDGAAQGLRRSLGSHHVVSRQPLYDGWRYMVGPHYVHDVLGARHRA